MILQQQSLTGKNILVTCGPTWVPIDSVRVISNTSTGQMGHLIAQKLTQRGARVTLLEGPVTDPTPVGSVKVIKFRFYDELEKFLKSELKKKYSALLQCAAVSDYRLKKVFSNKINSDRAGLTLQLVPTLKLISEVKKINPGIFLVGFKLETKQSLRNLKQKARQLIRQSHCDLVLANSGSALSYRGYIIDPSGEILAEGKSKEGITEKLSRILCKKL